MKNTVLGLLLMVAATSAQAASFVWNGTANDGDWSNSANWAGAVPASLTANPADTITFTGTNMPTSNLATFSGALAPGAILVFNSGGTFGLDMSTSFNSGYVSTAGGTVITVGDNVGGGTEDVILNISNAATLLRHASVTMNYLVNSDGTMNFDGGLNLYADNNKHVTLTLDGGTISAAGTIDNRFNTQLDSFIEFSAIGSTFSANYGGGAFADFAAVQVDASGIFVNSSGGTLQFTDNGGNNFTVTAVPEPSSFALLALGLSSLFCLRRRK